MAMGKTLAEVQSLSGRELYVWWLYRSKYGPLNPVRMYDQAGALVATQVNNAHGGKAKPIDFMPYHPKLEEKELSEEQMMSAILAGGKIGR